MQCLRETLSSRMFWINISSLLLNEESFPQPFFFEGIVFLEKVKKKVKKMKTSRFSKSLKNSVRKSNRKGWVNLLSSWLKTELNFFKTAKQNKTQAKYHFCRNWAQVFQQHLPFYVQNQAKFKKIYFDFIFLTLVRTK